MPDRPLIAFANAAVNLIAYLNDAAWLPSPCPMDESLGAVTTSFVASSCASLFPLNCGREVREVDYFDVFQVQQSITHCGKEKKKKWRIIKLVKKISQKAHKILKISLLRKKSGH